MSLLNSGDNKENSDSSRKEIDILYEYILSVLFNAQNEKLETLDYLKLTLCTMPITDRPKHTTSVLLNVLLFFYFFPSSSINTLIPILSPERAIAAHLV